MHPDPAGTEIICKLGSGSVINSGSDSGSGLGFLTKFRFAKISRKWLRYETIFVFRENEGRVSRVSQFRETAEITKETSFAKHENRENEENFKITIFPILLLILVKMPA